MWGVDYLSGWYETLGTPSVNAIRQYFWPLDGAPEAKKVHSHQKAIIRDMSFVLSFQVLSGIFSSFSKADTVKENSSTSWGLLNSTNLYCLSWLSSMIAYRFLLKARTRTAVVYSNHSAIFKKAAAEEAKRRGGTPIAEVSDSVCQDCKFGEKMESQAFSFLSYYVQQFIIEHGVGSVPVVGPYLSTFMMVVAAGNQVVDSALSPSLCAKHREIFMKEYMSFCLKEGMKVEAATQLTALVLSRVTGVSTTWYVSEIRSLFTMAEVERLQKQEIPDPVASSTALTNPLVVMQAGIRGAAQGLLPLLVTKIKEVMSSDGEPIDMVQLIQTIDKYHQNKTTQFALLTLLPHMLVSPQNFVNDEVVKDYWEPILNKIYWLLNTIRDYHIEYTSGVKGRLVSSATTLAPNKSLKILANYLNMSLSAAEKLFEFAISDQYFKTDEMIRQILTSKLGIKEDLALTHEDEKFLAQKAHVHVEPHKPYALLPLKVEQAIKDYREYDNADGGWDWGTGREGRRRADIYRYLLAQSDEPAWKQLICYCAFTNPSGGTLHKRLRAQTPIKSTFDKNGLWRHILSTVGQQHESDITSLVKSINSFANSNPEENKAALVELCQHKSFKTRFECMRQAVDDLDVTDTPAFLL